MSITSSNNLAVNNSLTVNGNSIFGVDNTSTLICNSKPTFNSDVTISGNIAQSSGTFSTGSGNVNLNGDVVISSNKKLTTGTGDTTINGLLKCNGNINNVGLLTSSGSFELGPTTGTNFTYIDVKTTGGNSDYDTRIGVTGGSLSTSGQGALAFNCLSCAIAAPLTVNGITCTSINNSGTLTQTGAATLNSLSATSINNSGAATLNSLSATSINNSGTLTQTGAATLNSLSTTSINNSGTLTQTGASTLNSLSATSINNSGTSTFTGVLYTYNGITNSNAAIVNNSTLAQVGTSVFADVVRVSTGKSVYVSDVGMTNYLRMHHSGAAGYFDCTGGLNFRNGTTDNFNINGSTNQATFNYNLNTNGITNNAALYQNSNATFSNAITAPSISSSSSPFYAGSGNNYDTAAITAPKVINGIATGTGDAATYTTFNLAINSWQGVGFVYANSSGPPVCKLVIDTRTGNLSTLGSITCNSLITSTAITTPSITTPSITCANNCMFPGGINNSLYYSVKGSNYNNSTATTVFYYIKYDGTSGSSASESFQMNSYAICAKITYSYYSDFPSNTYQGLSEYVVYGANFGAVTMAWSVGALQYQPTITCSSTGLITVTFAKNIALTGHITWSVGVLII